MRKLAKWVVVYTLDSAPTYVTSQWAERYIKFLKDEGEDVTVASPPFGSTLLGRWWYEKTTDANVLVYLGHGLPSKILGQATFGGLLASLIPLIKVGDKPEGTTIYSLSCLTGIELLPYLAKKLEKNGIGFTNYAYIAYNSVEHNYMRDFGDLYFTIIKALQQREPLSMARRRFIRKANELISLYRDIGSFKAKGHIKNLRKLKEAIQVYGNKMWRLP